MQLGPNRSLAPTRLDFNEARDDGVLGCIGISWTICKQSAPRCRQITTPTPHRSIFTGQMLFLMPIQWCQIIEGTKFTQKHTHPFNDPFSGTTRVSRYQKKAKPSWILLKQETVRWQWHQLGRMQICTSLQTDNHANTPPLSGLQCFDAVGRAAERASGL